MEYSDEDLTCRQFCSLNRYIWFCCCTTFILVISELLVCVCVRVCMCVCWSLSHVQLFNPMDGCPPSYPVHGILQVRILQWVALPSPGDLSDPGIEPVSPLSPALQSDSLPTEPWGKPKLFIKEILKKNVMTLMFIFRMILLIELVICFTLQKYSRNLLILVFILSLYLTAK